LNLIYGLATVIFLLDISTSFDIKNQGVKSLIYFAVLIGTPLALIWNLFFVKAKTKRIFGTILLTGMLTLIVVVGPLKIMFSTGAWQTQTILYQHGHLSFRTVEFQLRDVGAFGYNKRTVEVFYLTPLFMITSKVPEDIEKKVEWVKVNKDVNEHPLKFP
jgi:hypothetical protein